MAKQSTPQKTYNAQLLVAKFNAKYPVGSQLSYLTVANDEKSEIVGQTRSKAFFTINNEALCFFEGLPGYYSINPEHVK